MGTKQFNNYEDLLTFTRASKGHALRPVSYGSELVTNGTYDTDLSGWDDDSVGTGTATVSSGQVSLNRVDASNRGGISQSHTLVTGAMYLVSFELVSGVVQVKYKGGSGSLSQTFNGENWNQLTTAGVYQTRFVATGTDGDISLLAINNGVTAIIDNVSVKEVTFDESDGTLTLFEHPNNIPRVEYDGSGNRLGLLVEESRANLVAYSEDFESSYWTKQSSVDSVEDGNIAGPDGTLSGTKVTTNAVAYVTRDTGIYSTQNSTVTFSAFLKAGSITTVGLHYAQSLGDGLNDNCDFDLSNGTVSSEGSASTAKIKYVGNGWYRCSNTYTTNGSGTGLGVRFVVQGAGTYYVYGAQLEEGSFPTSYIKSNSGSTTTRSADVASIPVADFGYNTAVGSVVAEYNPLNVSEAVNPVFELSSDSTDNRLYSLADTIKHWFVRFNAVTTVEIDLGTPIESQQNKIAGAYKKDDFAASLNGGAVGTDTAGSMFVGIEDILIGSLYNNYYLNGHIKSIKYYPRRLTNAQLQEITS